MPGFELFGDAERKEVLDVLDNGVLMRYGFDAMRKGHWKAKELESLLGDTLEVKYCQLVSSGTAAVSVALASAGVGAGDEVIMPTFTFVASFEAIMMLGAVPVLVDIDDTLTIDPAAVEAAITSKTKAVMMVQMCGSMGHMDAIKDLCNKYHLVFVEDACQAIGATYKDKPLGGVADIGCFSFDFVKTITCGEGGAVVTNNEAYFLHADHFSDHGHDHIGSDRGAEEHPFLGYNFRISELHAAVGLAQAKRLREFVEIQQRNAAVIREELSKIGEVAFRTVPDGGVESGAFVNFYLPDLKTARAVSSEFSSNGIEACFHYYDNNWHYIRKWGHLKNKVSLYPLYQSVSQGLERIEQADFSKSDHYIGRNISCLVKLSWSRDEVQKRAEKMAQLIRKVLSSQRNL